MLNKLQDRQHSNSGQTHLNPLSLLPHIQGQIEDQLVITKMVCTFPDCVARCNSGANIALTNDRNLLIKFTIMALPFPIGTIGPKPILASTHRGVMQLPMVEGLYERFNTYYSKDSGGSVMSFNRHISKSQGRLQQWI